MLGSWLFWALGAALIWGVGQVFVKHSLSRFTPLLYNIVTTPLDVIILTPFALFFGLNFKVLAPTDFLLLIFIAGTYLFYYYAVSQAEISLSGTVLSTYPVSTMFFAMIFLGERLSPWQFFWIAVLILGVVLIGLPPRSNFKFGRWFGFAIFSAVLIGFGDFLAKVLIDRVGVGNYLFFYGWAFLPGLLVNFFLDKRSLVRPNLRLYEWPQFLLGAAFIALGVGFFSAGLAFGPASLVAPISTLYAAITVVLSLIFLRERLTKTQALGVGLSIAAVVLIGA